MSQLTTLADNAVAVRGMVELKEFASSFANTDAAGFEAGRFIVRDATELESVRAPALTAEVSGPLLEGVSMWLPGRTGSDPEYAEFDMVSVLKRARIWVNAMTAMSIDDTVSVVFSGANAGRIRNTIATSVVPAGAVKVIIETSGVDQLCLIEVQLP